MISHRIRNDNLFLQDRNNHGRPFETLEYGEVLAKSISSVSKKL